MPSLTPSSTTRGQAWLTNFADTDRPTARLLLDSLQVKNPAEIYHGLKDQIRALTPLLKGHVGVLIPVLSVEDINKSLLISGRANEVAWERHVAYDTFAPGTAIHATPGSEAAIGNLIRDFTGDRQGSEPGPWLHPGTDLETLHRRRCRLVVLVTDYSGSGRQVDEFAATFTRNARLRSWRSFGWLQIVLVAYAASSLAQSAAEASKSIDKVSVHLPAASFSDAPWTGEEREAITSLCDRYTPSGQRKVALGYGGSAGLFFTHTSVPNNLPFILRRSSKGWKHFLEGRAVPADLAAELDHYQAAGRDLGQVARAANQDRLARAIDSKRLRAPADHLLVLLALMAWGVQTPATLAHRLALPDQQVRSMLEFLQEIDFITPMLTVTERGRSELGNARRLDRIATAHLSGKPEPYYPQSLR